MKSLLIAVIMIIASTANAKEAKGCSNFFEIGRSTKTFVVECMKVDGIAVRSPESIRTYQSQYSLTEIYVYGRTTFHFKNGILDYIIN